MHYAGEQPPRRGGLAEAAAHLSSISSRFSSAGHGAGFEHDGGGFSEFAVGAAAAQLTHPGDLGLLPVPRVEVQYF